VRRNAALQLVRFGDTSGRPELRSMLQPFEAKSPIAGSVTSLLPAQSKISAGGLIARIRDSSNALQEFRSPVDGAIGQLALKEGDSVVAGQTVVWLTPDRATVSNALQALAYAGTKDDLPAIESCLQADTSAEIRQQGTAAMRMIKSRAN
jgi:multidrug efflux pump subunit AcrA (membrane-fusion protein)